MEETEKIIRKRIKGMNKLDLRIRLRELRDVGELSEEEYTIAMYAYVKELCVELTAKRLNFSRDTYFRRLNPLLIKLSYLL